jgi:hypothetical protein
VIVRTVLTSATCLIGYGKVRRGLVEVLGGTLSHRLPILECGSHLACAPAGHRWRGCGSSQGFAQLKVALPASLTLFDVIDRLSERGHLGQCCDWCGSA